MIIKSLAAIGGSSCRNITLAEIGGNTLGMEDLGFSGQTMQKAQLYTQTTCLSHPEDKVFMC